MLITLGLQKNSDCVWYGTNVFNFIKYCDRNEILAEAVKMLSTNYARGKYRYGRVILSVLLPEDKIKSYEYKRDGTFYELSTFDYMKGRVSYIDRVQYMEYRLSWSKAFNEYSAVDFGDKLGPLIIYANRSVCSPIDHNLIFVTIEDKIL